MQNLLYGGPVYRTPTNNGQQMMGNQIQNLLQQQVWQHERPVEIGLDEQYQQSVSAAHYPQRSEPKITVSGVGSGGFCGAQASRNGASSVMEQHQ